MDASKLIDKKIEALKDWRGKTMADIRRIVHQADPEVVEEWKWMGTPTWSHEGILCIADAHKEWVRMTFHKGASLPDPKKVFNSGLEGGTWRAIKFLEGDKINEPALENLIRAALALNLEKANAGKSKGSNIKSGKAKQKKKGSKK